MLKDFYVCTPTIKGNKISWFFNAPIGDYLKLQDIGEIIRGGSEIKIRITVKNHFYSADKWMRILLLSIINKHENVNKNKNIPTMRRAIKAGGWVKYIGKLEKQREKK